MSTKRNDHTGSYQRAGAGLAMLTAGEVASQRLKARGTTTASIASRLAPRGLGAVGVPLAASGLVGVTHHRRSARLDPVETVHDVVDGYTNIPGRRKRQARKKQAAATLGVTGAALLGGTGARRYAARRAYGVTRSAGLAAGGTASAAAAATLAEQRLGLSKAAPREMSREELWRRKSNAANLAIATTALGGASIAARGGSLIRPVGRLARVKPLSPKLETASNRLLTGAGITGTASGISSYRNSRYELGHERQQIRRLQSGRREQKRPVSAPMAKADRFIRTHGDRISPQAEQGYEYLRRGRNKRAGSAALTAGLTGVNVHAAVRGGKVMRPVGAGLAVLTGSSTVSNARGAARWNGHMDKIKAKAYERAAAGEYGRGREVHKDDLAKALMLRPAGLPFPKGLRRRPAMRAGGVRRTAYGQMVSYRGSYG